MTTSTISTSTSTSSLRTRRRRQQAKSPALRGAAAVLLFTTAVASAAAGAAAAAALPTQQHSCLGFVPAASSSGQIRRPRAAVGALAPRTGTRLYVAGSGAGNGGAGGDDDKKEELYYQRFLGMNEGEPTDEVRLAAEIADMDPSTIDSLRRGTTPAAPAVQPVPPQPLANPFYGSAGSMDGAAPSTTTPTTSSSPAAPQQQTPFGGVGGAAGGFLNSVKKAATGASVGSGSSFVPLVNGGNDDMLMSGPKAYVIPQDDRETPLEIRSVPTPRRSQKGVIAEVPGRRLPKRPGRVDLGEKMAEVKRSLKEAPTRLTEMQVQNLRNNMGPGGNTATATPPSPNKPAQGGANNKDGNPPFTFPSFPVQLPNAQQQPSQNKPFAGVGGPGSSGAGGRQRGLKRRGAWGTGTGTGRSPKSSLPAWSRDWRVIIGAIAAVSFLGALFSSLGSRSELIVMNDQGAAGGVAEFLLQNAAEIGGEVDKYFV